MKKKSWSDDDRATMQEGKPETWKVDRRAWGPGPWDGEPDRIEWQTPSGLIGLIVRNRLGGLCGYVAVPKGHPAYEMHYDTVHERNPDLHVHGGLTYAERCQGPVCHTRNEGDPDNVWWLGFDCVHAGDTSPFETSTVLPESFRFKRDGVYRDTSYVVAEVEKLAEQLAEMK